MDNTETTEPVKHNDEEHLLHTTFRDTGATDVGLKSIEVSDVKNKIKELIKDSPAADIDEEIINLLAYEIARRTSFELELLIRISNPKSSYQPEWLDVEDLDTPYVDKIVSREDYLSAKENILDVDSDHLTDIQKSAIGNLIDEYLRANVEAINDFYATESRDEESSEE